MARISRDKTREIIDSFAKVIDDAKKKAPEPQRTVINFRDEHQNNESREVYTVPIDLLRYRKDNGRIASDVLSYERKFRPLDEKEEDDQKILEDFLKKKDPERTKALKNAIFHRGQEQPAVITCDGFLINGNRRKMVLEMLREEHGSKFDRMRVVILPGKDDKDGGPPTIKEIEQIENRYQLQDDGKSEYGNFDRALTIRRKIDAGMSLEEQLKDDPSNALLPEKEFKAVVRKYKEDYLGPLECVDEYLDSLNRQECYDTISTQINDPKGRWQAFIDYYKTVKKKLDTAKGRIDLGIEEDEVGEIQDAAFKIIRFREFKGRKLHALMRDLPKYLKNEPAKKEVLKLNDDIEDLEESELYDENGDELDFNNQDNRWRKKNQTNMYKHIEQAIAYKDRGKEMDTPLALLEQAYKKLTHDQMNPDSIGVGDIDKAMKLAADIKEKANELESEFFHWKKQVDKLTNKNKKK